MRRSGFVVVTKHGRMVMSWCGSAVVCRGGVCLCACAGVVARVWLRDCAVVCLCGLVVASVVVWLCGCVVVL